MAAPICLWRHREAFAVRASLGLPIAVGGLLATGCRETPKAASRPPEPVQVTQVIQLYSIDHLPRRKGEEGATDSAIAASQRQTDESLGVNGRAPN